MASTKLAAVLFTITLASSFPFGYQLGVMNQPLELISHFIGNVTLERTGCVTDAYITTITSLCVTAFLLGGLFGGLIGGCLANKLGRRRSLLILSAPCLLSAVFLMTCKLANSFEMIIVGRALVGIACGAHTVIGPVYLSEIAPPSARGAAGVLNMMILVFALMLSQILGLPQLLNTVDRWPYLIGLHVIPCAISFVCLLFSPESPRYTFLIKRDIDEASKALLQLRPLGTDITSELTELTMEAESSNKISLQDLWHKRHLRWALLVAVVVQIAQQFSGMSGLLYYSRNLFISSHLTSEQATFATIGIGGTQIVVSFVAAFTIDRIGRKVLLIGGLLLASMSLGCFTILLVVKTYVDAQWLVYAAVASVFLFICGFGIGAGSIPWFIVAELFTQETRDAANSIAISTNWLCNIAVGLSFIQMIKYFGIYSFVPFIMVTLASVLFLSIYLPETKGQNAASIEAYFLQRVHGGRTSKHGVRVNDGSVSPRTTESTKFRDNEIAL